MTSDYYPLARFQRPKTVQGYKRFLAVYVYISPSVAYRNTNTKEDCLIINIQMLIRPIDDEPKLQLKIVTEDGRRKGVYELIWDGKIISTYRNSKTIKDGS